MACSPRRSRVSLLLAVTMMLLAAFVTAAPTCAPGPDDEAGTSTTPATTPATTPSTTTVEDDGSYNGRAGLEDMEVIGTAWYPGWLSGTFPPSSISWSRYNMMTFAFAVTTEDPAVLDLLGQEEVLKTFVAEARKNDVKALLSIGGWTGSRFFSPHVATPESRATFAKAITDMAVQYELDGIDFDWEYPNLDGIGCNEKSPQDTANFLTFLQELKASPPGSRLMLTAAASIKPFMGEDAVITDASAFGEVFDVLAIMNYDIYGPWADTTGPNAPLRDSCSTNPATRLGSAESAVAAWTEAGFPAEKLLLGVAAYGRSFQVPLASAKSQEGSLNLFTAFDKTAKPFGEDDTADANYTNTCGVVEGPSGVWTFKGLIESGILGADGNPADGIDYTFDECSQTPFVYNQDTQVMITFDDARSFEAKGKFIDEQKLRGYAVWHVLGDSSDDLLLDSIHKGARIITEEVEVPADPEGEGEGEGCDVEVCEEEPTDGESDDDYYS
uniref:Chitinase 2 n=1 Tax=Ephemerocybe congregata TaxID=5347 RepID=H9CWQ0_EPHCO|nr:chitinase 2 [Coprinellus congregatus]